MDAKTRREVDRLETLAIACRRLAEYTHHVCEPGCNLYNALGDALMAKRDHHMGILISRVDMFDLEETIDSLMRRTRVSNISLREARRIARCKR